MLLVILTLDPSYTNCPFITLGNFMKITLWKIANIESKRHASTLRHTVYGICVYGASSITLTHTNKNSVVPRQVLYLQPCGSFLINTCISLIGYSWCLSL